MAPIDVLDEALFHIVWRDMLPDICVSSSRRSTAPCDKAGSGASPRAAAGYVTHNQSGDHRRTGAVFLFCSYHL